MAKPEESPADDWASLSKEKNRDSFSELDVLLRALDRFFNIENLPLSKEDIPNKDFTPELRVVRDVILRTLGLLEAVIPEGRRNAYWFQKFAVAKYLNDRKRDAFREQLYTQDIPEKSLLLLYDSFVNLRGVVTELLKGENVPYLTFVNIGQITGKDLRENLHFNPFRKDLNPEFDVIENPLISKIVKGIRQKETKKCVSILLLSLFRFLRCLRHAESSARFGSLHSALAIILLLRSEITIFSAAMEAVSVGLPDESLQMLLRSLLYQFSVESKRVYRQELRGTLVSGPSPHLKGTIENCHGILRNLCEQSIIQVVQFFMPDIRGEEVFESFMTKLQQSLRLREDLLVLHRFLQLAESADSPEARTRILGAMRNYMLYFQSFTFRLLRFDDYEEFSSFFGRVFAFDPDGKEEKDLDKLIDQTKHFGIFVETCLRHLANRAELVDRPHDMARVEAGVNQYLR